MNGFIGKYRWIIVIVAGVLVAGLAYYIQQNESPVEVAVEEPTPPGETAEVEEPKDIITEGADNVVPEDKPVVVEPVLEAPVQESIAAVEPVIEVKPEQEPEPVDPVQEEATPVEVVVEEQAEEPVEEVFEESPEETTVEVVEEPLEELATDDSTKPESATSDEPTEEGIKPSFDVARVDSDGNAVIAGSAEPYSKVNILSNGEKIGEAIAGASGEFVALIQLPDNEQGQTLELETEVAGKLLFSEETILILPTMRSTSADTVTEETAPPIIRATAEDVVILQGGPQLTLGQVSLDSISYDENDEVALAGRGNPGRTIIIYVDDVPLTDTVVSGSGSWKQVLASLNAGRYILRVDEIAEDGTVSSRVESPFQREYPQDVRETKTSNETTYTVQPGNSLWIIATGRYGEGIRYMQIFTANKDQIRDPDLIYPGQVFAIPDTQE